MGLANQSLAVRHHDAGKHAAELVAALRRLTPESRTPSADGSLREMSRLVRVEWQTEGRALTFEHRLREAERERIDGPREIERVHEELEKVLSGRRYRAGAGPCEAARFSAQAPSRPLAKLLATVGRERWTPRRITRGPRTAPTSPTRCTARGRRTSSSSRVSSRTPSWSGKSRRSRASCARLASFSRLVTYDKRGQGLSDRPGRPPTLEESMDDLRAVMDAADCERAAIFGISEGGPLSALFAATHPDRVSSLVLYGTYARLTEAPGYPEGIRADRFEEWTTTVEREWGGAVGVEFWAPSEVGNREFEQWWARLLRQGTSPSGATDLLSLYLEIDVRSALGTIGAPALVLHRTGDRMVPLRQGALPGGADPRRPPGRAQRRRPPLLRRRQRRPAGRGRGVPRRQPPGPRRRPGARHGALHRHRRIDRNRRPARGSSLARAARAPRLGGAARARGAPGPRGEDHGRRLPRHLRRPRPGDPLRRLDPGRPRAGRDRDPGGNPHRRGRDDRRGRRRHGRQHRGQGGALAGPGRGAGVEHRERAGRRLGDRVPGARRPPAQGRAGRVDPVRGRRGTADHRPLRDRRRRARQAAPRRPRGGDGPVDDVASGPSGDRRRAPLCRRRLRRAGT